MKNAARWGWRIGVLAVLAAAAPLAEAQVTIYNSEPVWTGAVGPPDTLNFDAFAGSVSNQYPGVTMSSFNGGNPRSEARGWFQSSPNVLIANVSNNGGGGGFALDFETPQQGVGLSYFDAEFPGNIVVLKDSFGAVIGSSSLPAGLHFQWGFWGAVSAATPIARMEVTFDQADFVPVDNIRYAPAGVPATGYTVLEGIEVSGGLDTLFASDDNCLQILSDDITLRASVEVESMTANHNPSILRVLVETVVLRPGLSQAVDLYRFASGQYVTMAGGIAPVADTAWVVSVENDRDAFVGIGGELRARLTWAPINDEDPSLDGWIHCVDQVVWDVR